MSKFLKGQSGNPNGRPCGVVDRRMALSEVLDTRKKELLDKALALALSGDVQMLRFFLERLIPKPRGESISFDLPDCDITKPGALLVIGSEILKAVANQSLTPEQGKALTDIVEAQRKNIEAVDLSMRVTEIEGVLKNRITNNESNK